MPLAGIFLELLASNTAARINQRERKSIHLSLIMPLTAVESRQLINSFVKDFSSIICAKIKIYPARAVHRMSVVFFLKKESVRGRCSSIISDLSLLRAFRRVFFTRAMIFEIKNYIFRVVNSFLSPSTDIHHATTT
jgi:hypothetical protein